MSEVVIALDTMGGDKVPMVPLKAANLVKPEDGMGLLLFGDKEKIDAVSGVNLNPLHKVVHCSNSIAMDEKISRALLRDRHNTMVKALSSVKQGIAHCAVSGGNTAVFTSYAIAELGLVRNIERPAIAILVPNVIGKFTIFLDAGANVNTKVSHLVQSAQMGSLYASSVFDISNPRVAMLNVGSEITKGDDLRKAAYSLLSESEDINFTGNVEGQELFSGKADVIITDGFTGNAILKVVEGTTRSFKTMLLRQLRSGIKGKICLLLIKSSLQQFAKKIDYADYGGGMLLGVDGAVIISHGRSSPRALYSAMKLGRKVVDSGFIERLKSIDG